MKEVQCAKCQHIGYIQLYSTFDSYGHKWPVIWFCDTCKTWD